MQNNDTSIIVIEDDLGHSILIERNLKRSGINNPIIYLKDGEEAMDYFSKRKVREYDPPAEIGNAVVLLDLNLPKYSGFEILKKIRKTEETKHLPVIVLSSTTRDEEIRECYKLGCSMFLNKPLDYTTFAEAILKFSLLVKILKVSA